MSASENSAQNSFTWTGPYVVPDCPDPAEAYDLEADGPVGVGEPSVLPAPYAEKARAAAEAARGAGTTAWSALRAHKAATGGAAVAGTAAALFLAYTLGRRAGRRSARRGLGPVALLLDRRFRAVRVGGVSCRAGRTLGARRLSRPSRHPWG